MSSESSPLSLRVMTELNKLQLRVATPGNPITLVPVAKQIPTFAPRVEVNKEGLTIWHPSLFRDPANEKSRQLLSRIFSIETVEGVEIDPGKDSAQLRLRGTKTVPQVLRQLRQAITQPLTKKKSRPIKNGHPTTLTEETSSIVTALYLENPTAHPIRITRTGSYLSTWRVVFAGTGKVRLTHPLLRYRKDIAYRLEEELTAVQGVRDFKTNVFTSSILIRFNPRRLDVPRLLRHLEYCWPRLVNGLEGPPPSTRFFASTGLLTLSFTSQFFVPALIPVALIGVAIYGFANVVNALKALLKGQIGLPLLYTGTLTFTILSGQPFAASLMATFMQLWPRWSYEALIRSQRRLFATHRQRAIWARRVGKNGEEAEVTIDRLQTGDLLLVQEGEIIPVDGQVVEGLAAVDEEAVSGRAGALDKSTGDTVYAATYIKAGAITIEVGKIGGETMAGFIGEQLPHGPVLKLPSSAEAEQVATKMVTPTLALSGLNLLLTGEVLPSQSTIRPDYATGPRLGAQLATLHDLSDALRRGIVFRDPAALSRLPATDIYVFDDSSALERRHISVDEIMTASGVSVPIVLSYATSAFPAFQNDRARALLNQCLEAKASLLEITDRVRQAGVIRYRDTTKQEIQVGTTAYVESQKFKVPASIKRSIAKSKSAWAEGINGSRNTKVPHPEPQLRPLWVIRDRTVLGVVTFQRGGALEAAEIISTLRARNAQARFVHISSRPLAVAKKIASNIGISTVLGGLDSTGKVEVLKSLGSRTMWIGNGNLPESLPCIEASTISISVGGAATVPADAADIVFLLPSLRALVATRRIGRSHRALLKDGYRAIFTANLLCVVGAFFGGFNTLAVAITSNFATGYVYTTHRNLLNDLIARMESKMAKEVPLESQDQDTDESAPTSGANETDKYDDYSTQDLDSSPPSDRPV